MVKDFPYMKFLEISKKCRQQLINDTVKKESADLYDALYSDVNKEIFNIKMELYELKWIEAHWKYITDEVEKKDISEKEKQDLISIFARWYKPFVANWNYSEFDTLIFEEKINILQSLIAVNNDWEQNVKQMKVSFEQSKKRLNAKIKELEKEE